MKLRNEFSKALGFGMSYSDKVNGRRSRCWEGTGLTETEAVRRIVRAGLNAENISVTSGVRRTNIGRGTSRHYVRVTTLDK